MSAYIINRELIVYYSSLYRVHGMRTVENSVNKNMPVDQAKWFMNNFRAAVLAEDNVIHETR
jgi:hypothetical protein